MATANIPVFQVVVGAVMLLAVAGLAIATIPALRRRRPVVLTWVVIVTAVSLAALGNLTRLLLEFT